MRRGRRIHSFCSAVIHVNRDVIPDNRSSLEFMPCLRLVRASLIS